MKVGPVAVPFGVVTVTGPEVPPDGTVAFIEVEDKTVNVVVVPLNFTAVAPVKFVPVIVMLSPVKPEVSDRNVIVGSRFVIVNVKVLTHVPPVELTLIGPVVAPLGIVAVS